MRYVLGVLAVLCVADKTWAQPNMGPQQPQKPLSAPHEAVQVVAAELAQRPQEDWPFLRFFWVQSGSIEDVRITRWAMSLATRSANGAQLSMLGGGIVLMVDLRWLGDDDEVQQYIDVWEDFQFDPSFARLTTNDTLRFILQTAKDLKQPLWWREWKNGKRAKRWCTMEPVTTDTVVLRENGQLPEAAGLSKVQDACQTLAPIVESNYFIGRALSTIKDRNGNKENLFSTVWGGRYNELRGIRKSQVKGRSDLNQFFIDFTGVTFDSILGSRKTGRVSLTRSAVTGKPRLVLYFNANSVHPGLASGFGAITLDIRDEDVDHGDRSFKQLVTFRVRAYEAIVIGANGQLVYALFGEQGQLLDEADVKVVGDHRVPPPNTPRLQAAKSCIGCHGAAGGWQPFVGDAPGKGRLNVLTDLVDRKRSQADILDFIDATYRTGDPRLALRRANDDNGAAVQRVVEDWDGNLLHIASFASARLEHNWFADRYDGVDAVHAMKRFGLEFAGGDGAKVLFRALPPLKIEDPVFDRLTDGKTLTPQDFALSYSDGVARVWRNRERK